MKIICHRGYWRNLSEQNSEIACKKSIQYDGMEIDLRTKNGEIVLSHDMILESKKYTTLKQVFKKFPKTFFALNIKEDGMAPKLSKLIKKYSINNFMSFDHSSPESLSYKHFRLNAFARVGDHDGHKTGKEMGIVIDVFKKRNLKSVLLKVKKSPLKKSYFFISPELHKRNHLPEWKEIDDFLSKNPTIRGRSFLCTDFPEEARTFFSCISKS